MAEHELEAIVPSTTPDSLLNLYRIQYHQYETDIWLATTGIQESDRPAVLQQLEFSLNEFERSVTNVSEHL